jgi:hypothetical protein
MATVDDDPIGDDSADEPLVCVICGQALTGDAEDRPDWPTGPMCGECYRARQTDDDMAHDEGW